MTAGVLHDFVGHPEFRTGLIAGVAVTVLGGAVALVLTDRRRRVAPIGGMLVAIGFVVGVRRTPHLPIAIPIGLALLALAGLVAGRLGRRRRALGLSGVVLAIPGAVVLATHIRVPPVHARNYVSWVPPLVVVSIIVGGALLADFDRRFTGRGWPTVLYAISAVGVFFTVPDTERALVLLGVSVPLLLLGWPFALVSLGSAGSYAAAGVLVWVSATEGRGRHPAIVGGIACLGLFLVEPAARALRRGHPTVFEGLPSSWWSVFPVALVHLVLVYIASRVAGIRHMLAPAVTIIVVELVIATILLSRPDPPFGIVFTDTDRTAR